MVGSHLQHDFQVMFVLLQCGNALPQRLHLGQQGLAGGSSGWPCARHYSISRCKRGNRRWKFVKDFSCQGTAWLPLITTWVAAYCRACRTNFASVFVLDRGIFWRTDAIVVERLVEGLEGVHDARHAGQGGDVALALAC